MPPTLKDIAEKLNVSIVTVSKALNNKPDISKKTKQLIQKTAKELNYTPNGVARSLVRKNTNTLGVLVPDISEPFYTSIIKSIDRVSKRNNYNIILIDTDRNHEIEYKSVMMLLEKRVSGILIDPPDVNCKSIELLKKGEVPFVIFNWPSNAFNCNSVGSDNVCGAYLAFNYLINKGYEKFYYMYSCTKSKSFYDRLEGCKKAFTQNNIPFEELELIYCPRDINLFYDTALKRINHSGKRIGIHAWDDEMSIGVCKAILDKGLRIPEDVGIVGYDNIEYSKYSPIPLTTIDNTTHENQ